MTVAELIAALQKCPPEYSVWCEGDGGLYRPSVEVDKYTPDGVGVLIYPQVDTSESKA